MELSLAFQKVGIALGLGLLVGLQREHVHARLTGIRTFTLITVFGAVAALVGQTFGGWVVAAGWFAVAALLVMGNLARPKNKDDDVGLTTEVAALYMYGVGAYVVIGHAELAVALGGGAALLLYFKAPLHEFVERIGEADLKAIMQFVLVALVIFPVLPDLAYGPYGSLNPHVTWLMVVLIVGINLSGYVAYKLLGRRAGAVLGGVIGGVVSSTATTVSHSRQAKATPGSSRLAALVIVIASSVTFVRILVEVAVVAPGSFRGMAWPVAVMLGCAAAVSVVLYALARPGGAELPEQSNPADLAPALLFGAFFAAVVLGVGAAQEYLGSAGMYAVAGISGLHNLDAITLSTAKFVERGEVAPDLGWRLIVVAALSNLGMKALLVAALGNRQLLAWVAVPFAALFVAGLALMLLWPDG